MSMAIRQHPPNFLSPRLALHRYGSVTCLVLVLMNSVGCAHSLMVHPTTAAPTASRGHLSLSTGATISLLPGEIIPVQEYYYPPSPAQASGYGVSGLIFNPARTCTSCRVANRSVARLRYVPSPDCYLPPDFSGDDPKPCGRVPSQIFIEGVSPGKTTIEATVHENGETLNASGEIVVSNNPTRLAFIAPRWGDQLRQGDRNVISWRCGKCSPGDRLNVDIYNGNKSIGQTIAYLQPSSGSFEWDAKKVCLKDSSASVRCYDLPPGYYNAELAVLEGGSEFLHTQPFLMSAPFQVLQQNGAPAPQQVTNQVEGFIVAFDPDFKYFWLQTAASGKRLVCLSPTTPVYFSRLSSNSMPLTFFAKDVPVGGTPVRAEGVWEDAHSLECDGSGENPGAPPRLRVKDLHTAGSGIFGLLEKCRLIGRSQVCRKVSYMSVELSDSRGAYQAIAEASQHDGQYMFAIPPGRYRVFSEPVEVKPDAWTRLDFLLPE
jgi:hypothetical protein